METIELITKQDIEELHTDMQKILGVIKENFVEDKLLITSEIMQKLRIKSRNIFVKHIPGLKEYGMHTNGKGYRMLSSDLERYIRDKKWQNL